MERSASDPARCAMPLLQSYNPIVIGFVEGKSAVHVPLQTARDEYGQLPSTTTLSNYDPRERGIVARQ